MKLNGIVDEIVKRVLFYLLIISLLLNAYFILKSYYLDKSMLNNIYKPPKIIPKKKIVRVKGKVKNKNTEKPYELVLEENEEGEFELNEELSYIPDDFLTVDKVSNDTKFDFLKPIKFGFETNIDLNIDPVIFYNPLEIYNFSFGANTNFKNIGLNLSYNILDSNINIFSSYYLNNSISFGINLNIW